MTQSSDLIERLEKATGPDRELDRCLAVVAGLTWGAGHLYDEPWLLADEQENARASIMRGCPHFTSSIDAALTLLLPEWNYCVIVMCEVGCIKTAAAVGPNAPEFALGESEVKATEPRPAIALCIAALMARAEYRHDGTIAESGARFGDGNHEGERAAPSLLAASHLTTLSESRQGEPSPILMPRELLQRARDYIGSMPTSSVEGHDRFLEAARIVEPIEKLLAASPVPQGPADDPAVQSGDDYPDPWSISTALAKALANTATLHTALEESVKLQSHYAGIMNDHDGGARLTFPDAAAWIARLRATGHLK